MEHERIKELLEAYTLNALEPDAHQSVADHLASGCSECNAIVRETEEVTSQLALTVPQCMPSARVKSNIMREVSKAQGSASRVPTSKVYKTQWLIFAAAASVVLVLGIRLYLVSAGAERMRHRESALLSENIDLAKSMETSKLRIEQLQQELNDADFKLQEIERKYQSMQSRNLEISRNISVKEQKISSLNVALSDERRLREQLDGTLADSKSELANINLRLQQFETEKHETASVLTSINAELKSLHSEIEKTRDLKYLIASPCTRYINLASEDPNNPKAFGTVMLDPGNAMALIYIYRLPPPPNSMEYRLWAKRDGITSNFGSFDVTQDGESVVKLKGMDGLKEISAFMVTAEEKHNENKPKGMVYLSSPL